VGGVTATGTKATLRRAGGAWAPPAPARVKRIRERLREVYGVPLMAPHEQPISELILTVLSQSTNDRNRDVAFLRLRTAVPAWERVRDAPLSEVEEAIRPGGISKVKSARIQAILRAISDDPREPGREPGRLSLQWLPHVPLAEARDYLLALPGVGRKTAACVLLFAYGLRDVPVDEMLALTPPGGELELHVNLLRHGRRTCHARRPACRECALARMCPSRRLFE
jgi:endonuclease-3